MKAIEVRNDEEMARVLGVLGLTPTPLPDLPVTITPTKRGWPDTALAAYAPLGSNEQVHLDWDEHVRQSRMTMKELDEVYGDE